MTQPYAPRNVQQVLRLIDEYPLAWIVSAAAASFAASPLPLLAETDADGEISAFFGHIPLNQVLTTKLQETPRALVLFNGPQGYVSPEWVSRAQWAPSWNFAVAQFEVDVEFVPEQTEDSLERLIAKMESSRLNPWTLSRLGSRYAGLVSRIVAFRAHVRTTRARFKLGQDETPETRAELLDALPEGPLRSWMRGFNASVD